jgi:hypothetical protein
MLTGRLGLLGLAVVAALVSYATYVPMARSDPAYCLARASAFVREFDELLPKMKYSLAPLLDHRYLPVVDCDPGPLVEMASRSRFFQRVVFDERGQEYFMVFSSDEVVFSFSYLVHERTLRSLGAGWVNK